MVCHCKPRRTFIPRGHTAPRLGAMRCSRHGRSWAATAVCASRRTGAGGGEYSGSTALCASWRTGTGGGGEYCFVLGIMRHVGHRVEECADAVATVALQCSGTGNIHRGRSAVQRSAWARLVTVTVRRFGVCLRISPDFPLMKSRNHNARFASARAEAMQSSRRRRIPWPMKAVLRRPLWAQGG